MHSFPEGASTLFKWQVTSSKAAASIPYGTSLQFQKHEGCTLALNFSLPCEAKGETKKKKHAVTPEHVEGDTEVADPEHF